MQADPVTAERDNTVRDEGNAAHWLASVVFNGQYQIEELIDRKAPNGVFITVDMADHVAAYMKNLPFATDGEILNEWSHSFNGPSWQINGRADRLMYSVAHSVLYINDFKYGYSIVNPERNWTLIAHALGFCITRNVQPNRIVFVIDQPRAPHHEGRLRTWSITYTELTALYAEINSTLSNPSNMLQTGEHCYHCPSFLTCPSRQNAELNAIEAAHMGYNAAVDDMDLSTRLDMIARAEELLKQSKKAYQEEAIHRLKQGKVVKNYFMEDDWTHRVWNDGVTPELLRAISGVQNVTEPEKLISPRQAELAKVNQSIVDAFSGMRNKGKKLVRIDASKKAAKLFGKK